MSYFVIEVKIPKKGIKIEGQKDETDIVIACEQWLETEQIIRIPQKKQIPKALEKCTKYSNNWRQYEVVRFFSNAIGINENILCILSFYLCF